MIICNFYCPIYSNCKHKTPNHICIYDLGMVNDKDDEDDILERLTY